MYSIQPQERWYHFSGIAVPIYWNVGAISAGIFTIFTPFAQKILRHFLHFFIKSGFLAVSLYAILANLAFKLSYSLALALISNMNILVHSGMK